MRLDASDAFLYDFPRTLNTHEYFHDLQRLVYIVISLMSLALVIAFYLDQVLFSNAI